MVLCTSRDRLLPLTVWPLDDLDTFAPKSRSLYRVKISRDWTTENGCVVSPVTLKPRISFHTHGRNSPFSPFLPVSSRYTIKSAAAAVNIMQLRRIRLSQAPCGRVAKACHRVDCNIATTAVNSTTTRRPFLVCPPDSQLALYLGVPPNRLPV